MHSGALQRRCFQAGTQRPQSPLANARDDMPPHATAQRDAACQSLSRKSVEAEQDAGNQTLVQGIRAHLVAAAAIRCVHVDLQPAGTAAESNRLCLLAALWANAAICKTPRFSIQTEQCVASKEHPSEEPRTVTCIHSAVDGCRASDKQAGGQHGSRAAAKAEAPAASACWRAPAERPPCHRRPPCQPRPWPAVVVSGAGCSAFEG